MTYEFFLTYRRKFTSATSLLTRYFWADAMFTYGQKTDSLNRFRDYQEDVRCLK